jgi:hypothetical protein
MRGSRAVGSLVKRRRIWVRVRSVRALEPAGPYASLLAMRFALRELTPARVSAALERRVVDVPHALSFRFSAEARANRARIERFRDRHRGERCFILGNGPSLGRMDLSPLRGEITFGMNRIYLLFPRLDFVPTYYTCINELVLEQYAGDIARLSMPRFLNWNRRQLFGNRDDVAFLRTGLGLRDFFGEDAGHTLCSGGTVTFVTLQLAYYMGFREVILIGVDHRFAEGGTPNRVAVRSAARDDDHFHPEYFPRGSRWQLPDLRRSELAYALAREAFARAGGRVLDATDGGRCPVFERADYAALLA